ncbi:TonB-dependent receptor plug domain-containing protein [Xiashengella succiniciproducens]|uniref:TonB-dependent receptor n=1 Tax=Xiashengella succiniciproducens TaxID=2949635 RepID=A0A9J6ZTB6_9BACT|nr:TonB-dependent receptor [Alkaliflexus sp. Ai-910]URW80811.1 TonB-dependent receptor [Alkaliflexus sp. Ai-910]
MKKRQFSLKGSGLCFKKWSGDKWAVFNTLHREIKIGILAAVYFTTLGYHQTLANTESDSISSKITLNEIQVSGKRAPGIYQETGRQIAVISREQIEKLPAQSIQGLLRTALGVDIRERGPLGMQADISMRGGSFDQVMILLNGINVTDPQTGHYGLNLPVDLASVERIEILRGPAARVHGPNAFDGAINFVTKSGSENKVSAQLTAGDHGLYNLHAGLSHRKGAFGNYFSAQKGASDGYIDNTDFDILNLYYRGQVTREQSKFSLQLGYNDKSYGANSFYSASYPNQFDANRTLFAAASMESSGLIRIRSDVYWRRHHDRFELFRNYIGAASWYTGHNYHLSETAGASLNATTSWSLGTTSLGAELRSESIWSNVLGLPMDKPLDVPGENEGQFTRSFNRTNFSVFAEHNIYFGRFDLSGGVLINRHSNSGYGVDWYPGIDLSYRLTTLLKWTASYNRSLRMPTFTDLFYSGPTNVGNPNLKPERAETYETTFRLRNETYSASVGGFYRIGRDLIDWGRIPGETVYTTSNINRVEALGTEAAADLLLSELIPGQTLLRSLSVNYSYVWQDKVSDEGYESYYVLDHLRQKLNISLIHGLGLPNVELNWNIQYRDRAGYYTKSDGTRVDHTPFWLTDLRVSWNKGNYGLYAEASNLFDATYSDLSELRQPGLWLKLGARIELKIL